MENKNYTREEICQLSSLLYRAEKYELIIKLSKDLIKDNPVLSDREEQVFIEGYSYTINKELKSFSILLEIQKKDTKKKRKKVCYLPELIIPVKEKIITIADDFDQQIDILIQKAYTYEKMIHYITLKLKYIRYKCQCMDKTKDTDLLNKEDCKFNENYLKAEDLANNFLSKDSATYLELLLEKAIYLYEIKDDTKSAKNIAKQCMNECEKSTHKKELFMIYNTCKNNYIIWSKKSASDLNL